ncbi:MAG: ABC transporter permease, partial [Rhodoferax sp.]|nr:ABC transporter permease [Rhodoferax sp.]
MQDRLNRRSSLACILGLAAGLAQANEELDDLAKIRARGTLKVAVYNDNPPFSSGKSPDVVGLDVALAAALARQLGLKLVLLPFDAGERMNDDLRNMVWRGHYLGYGPADVMLQVPVDKYLIDDNRQVMIFAPYMRQVPVLLHDISKLPRVEGPGDLEGLALAAESGTGTATVLIGHNGRSLSSKVSLFPSGVQAAGAVLKGDVAAAYVLRPQAEAAVLQGGG